MHGALMAFRNRAHQGQAQAHTAMALAGAGHAVEGFKNTFTLVRRHTGAPVSHADFSKRALLVQKQGDRALGVAAGVFQQVAHGAAQQLGNAAHLDHIAMHVGDFQVRLDAGAFFGAQADDVDHLGAAHIRLAGAQATGQQDFVDQLVQLGDIALDLLLEGGRGLVTHQLHAHADAGQGAAQLMRGVGQQRFVRLHQGLDAGGSGIELLGQVADLVIATHIEPHRQIAIAKLLDPFAQRFEPAHQAPDDGEHANDHDHANEAQHPEETKRRLDPEPPGAQVGRRWAVAFTPARAALQLHFVGAALVVLDQVEHQLAGIAGLAHRLAMQQHRAIGTADQQLTRGRLHGRGIFLRSRLPGPANHQDQHGHAAHHGEPDAQVKPLGEVFVQMHAEEEALGRGLSPAVWRRRSRHRARSECGVDFWHRPRSRRGCDPCVRQWSGQRLQARGHARLP